MSLIEIGCLPLWISVAGCAGAFVADEHGGWGVGLPVAGAVFVAIPFAVMLASRIELGVRRLRAKQAPKEGK